MKNCIYYMIDENKIPFYVGQTTNLKLRIIQHNAEIKKGTNLPKYNKLRKLINNGILLKNCFYCAEENINRNDLDEREIYHINTLKNQNIRLYNLTEGGHQGKKSKESVEKTAAGNRGKKRSEKTKRLLSDIRIGIKFSDSHKKNLSIAWNKRKLNPVKEETKEKRKLSSIGKINIKKYEIIDPFGNMFITENGLCNFCRDNNLTPSLLHKVANGEREHHKNWKCRRL